MEHHEHNHTIEEHESDTHGHTDRVEVSATEEKVSKPNLFIRSIIVLGMIVILLVLSFGIFNLIPKTFSSLSGAAVSLSSIFSSKSNLGFSIDKSTLKNNDKFTIAWNSEKTSALSDDKKLYVSFQCKGGARVQYQTTDGEKQIYCNTLFPLPKDKKSITLLLQSDATTAFTVPFTLSVRDTKTQKVDASESIDVTVDNNQTTDNQPTENIDYGYSDTKNTNNSTSTKTVSTSTKNTTKGSTTRPTNTSTNHTVYSGTPINPNGKADLKITVTQTGIINSAGQFVATDAIGTADKAIIRFQVENVGDNVSGGWYFTAQLPTTVQSDKNYTSSLQQSLKPGDLIDYTLGFDSFDSSVAAAIIQVNPNGSVNELNTANNAQQVTFKLGTNNSNNNGNTTANQYNPNISADLLIRITDIGVLRNGQFVSTNSFNTSDHIAVKFDVTNVGGTSSGSWSLKANIPTQNSDYYTAASNVSLQPGQKTSLTLGFDGLSSGTRDISIQVDYTNNLSENNESNNYDSRTITVYN